MLFHSFILGDKDSSKPVEVSDSFPHTYLEIIYKGINSLSGELGNEIPCGLYQFNTTKGSNWNI